MSISIRRSLSAVTRALTLCATAPLWRKRESGVPGDPQVEGRVRWSSYGNLSLTVFPMSPKQGDVVTIVVSVTNTRFSEASFVVVTRVSNPDLAVISCDERVVAISANSTASYGITFSTGGSNRDGRYAIVAQSYHGDSVPTCVNCLRGGRPAEPQ